MIFLGVLGTEKTFLTPEKPVGRVLVASNVQQCGRDKTSLGDETARSCNWFVFTGLEMMGGYMSQNTLTRKAATADALSFLGQGRTPLGGIRIGWMMTFD